MKIELIKDHVLGKKGDTISVSQPRGDYLIRMGVAKLHVAKVKVEQEEKPKPKKRLSRNRKLKNKCNDYTYISKEYLNIDFDDYDSMLQRMLDASIDRAETITGVDKLGFNSEIKLAIMKDVAFAFENRGGSSQINTDTLATYRRNSLRPIF